MWALTLLLAANIPDDPAFNAGDHPLLMRSPTVSKTQIVFQFAGDLWSVPREGGDAVRITNSPGVERSPFFSPDGQWIAFSGQYDGNTDVYVMPAKGGVPKRLTYHPSPDAVCGWTPDGKSVIFSSGMEMATDLPRLFTVPMTGGLPKALPFPSGYMGSLSPDGKQLAYVPGMQWQAAWKRYRGGQTFNIWVGDLADSKVTEIPRKNTNDKCPMWVGDKIFYLSDKTGPFGLYSFDTKTKSVSEVVKGSGFDIKDASAGPGAIVYEQLGSIRLYDLNSKTTKKVDIRINGDFPEVRPQFKSLAPYLSNGSISPSGNRVAFEARGHIFTVPAAKGDARDITSRDGVAERYPSWSPDGKTIAYLSDESGEYRLVLRDAGSDSETDLELGQSPGYYYALTWSPDSKRIAYTDNKHNLWVIETATGKNTLVDTATYEDPSRNVTPSWSPDGKWLTFHRDLDNHLNAIFIYDVEHAKLSQVTDGSSNAQFPVFDKGGDYLYFVASTNTGVSAAWLDLSSYNALNKTSAVYAIALRKDVADPNRPQSDEEGDDKEEGENKAFSIDLDGIGQRIVAMPMPMRNYVGLIPGSPGSFFALDVSPIATVVSQPQLMLWKYDLEDREPMPFARNVTGADVTPKGDKLLLIQGPVWSIVPTAMPPQPGQGVLDLDGLEAKINPLAEWKQMYREVWRIERDFLYAPNFHGIDLKTMAKRYEPFLDGIKTRDELNYLFEDMLGELCIGHMFISGGDSPSVDGVPGGLLGADYSIEANRYRLARVYDGENWNPGLMAPLTRPGVSAKAGEYILAIDGKDLTAKDDIYERLEATAGRQVKLRIGPNPSETGSREVVVVPIPSETGLRFKAWEEDNRRTVEKLSGGRLGYAHIPDTNVGGWTNFNRYYYAQIRKDGMIIDERFNHGGQVDDYMVENMSRPLMSMWTSRYGKDFASPASTNFGPKVMITNQFSGSGGDYFPWHFKKAKVGPVVGKRTWGGLVGILVFPTLIDGGSVTAPNIAFYNPNGTWDVENHGVDPDVEVELDPYLWRKGRDAQLEKAVEVAMEALKNQKLPVIKKPAYPDKSKLPPGG